LHIRDQYSFSVSIEHMPLFPAYSGFFIIVLDEAQTQQLTVNKCKKIVSFKSCAGPTYTYICIYISVMNLFPIILLFATV